MHDPECPVVGPFCQLKNGNRHKLSCSHIFNEHDLYADK